MAEEKEVKQQTNRKPRTTKKVEEEPNIQDQMNMMMQMMQQQQQMFMAMMQQMQQPQQVAVVQEEVKEEPRRESKIKKSVRTSGNKITKQQLRRKYKDTDIYLTNITKGSVALDGRREQFIWEEEGECVPVGIDDILGHNEIVLRVPWLILDDYENDEEVLEDIIECLGLEDKYDYLYLLKELEDDINNVAISRVKKAIDEAEVDKGSVANQIAIIIQEKILNEELTNNKLIKEYEKLLHKNFKKE